MVAVSNSDELAASATAGPDRIVATAMAFVLRWPKLIITLGIGLILVAGSFLPSMVTDTRPNAFLQADNPALLYREQVKQQFGLSDPLIIAVRDTGEHGIFNPEALALVQWLSDEIFDLPNVDRASSFSLATENSITGTADGLDVKLLFDEEPVDQDAADALRQVLNNMPVYQGTLVARDGSVTLLAAELEDEFLVEETYQHIMAIVERAAVPDSVSLHVAGEGAIAGFLAEYIDADAKRLNPIAWLIIMLILFVAYRRLSPLLMANVIIAASAVISLGMMAANDIPFFMITSALPVILIGISVADTIHIYSYYFDRQVRSPELTTSELVMQTILAMWRPVTLTTLTTMAGFMGLYFAALMPPFKYFGLFAALGVFVAWAYSMLVLPAAMVLFKPKASPGFSAANSGSGGDVFSRIMRLMQLASLGYPRLILIVFVSLSLAGTYAASQLVVDEEPITIFDPSEPIYVADSVINQHMDGANALDIVIKTDAAEGLFLPRNLQKMEALQDYAETLQHVGGTVSIVDYLKQMNKGLNNGDPLMYKLPDSAAAVAQYFLLYSISGDPTDFEEEVDYDYQTANIRININSGSYQDFKPIVEQLQSYIDREFTEDAIQANLSGRVNLNYHWISDLARSHYLGLLLALVLVWVMASLLFNSALAGIYAMVPVAGSVLLVYAAMVLGGLQLGVGTSMFAAVAIGLGVDFSIHTLSHLKKLHRDSGQPDVNLFTEFYQTTGKALMFNFLAIACGFGVLISSSVSSLNNFGAILVVAITSSFVASMTLLPVLVYMFRPAFISGGSDVAIVKVQRLRTLAITAAVTVVALLIIGSNSAAAAEQADASNSLPSADELVSRINQVDDGDFVTRKLTMQMVDKRGKTRERETIIYRKDFGYEIRTILFYLQPSNVRDTGFLIWDYADSEKDDDQWLYIPALRKVRRISAADRGDYFLGTDFSYEDIKQDGKLEPLDYHFETVGVEDIEGTTSYRLAATPHSPDIAKELGYSHAEFWVDPDNWVIFQSKFWDLKGKPLKTLLVSDIHQVDGIWTRHRLVINNHKTGHTTRFIFSEVDYQAPVTENLFSKRALARGH